MDVEDGVREGIEQRCADQAHEAGQADEAHAGGPQLVDDRGFERLPAREAAVFDDNGANARRPRPFETGGVSAIRDHDANRRPQPAFGNGVDERLQVAAPPRDEDAQRPRLCRIHVCNSRPCRRGSDPDLTPVTHN